VSDGGQTALGGFLWQAHVALGLSVLPLIGAIPEEGNELDAILDLDSEDGGVRLEAFEQDVLMESPTLRTMGIEEGDTRILVQVKFSRLSDPPSISEEALNGIQAALEKSAARASMAGKPVTRFALITNRHCDFLERTAERAGEEPASIFLRSIGQTPFHIITRVDPMLWASYIERLGHLYGCRTVEILAGMHRLIGRLFEETQVGKANLLLKEDVLEALTGLRNPRALSAAAINEWDDSTFTHMLNGMRIRGDASSISDATFTSLTARRDALDMLSARFQTHALILVTGQGGMGKTVATGQWISERRAQRRAVALLRTADVVNSEHYLTREARSWAADSAEPGLRGMDTLPEILDRLALANSDEIRPLLLLALDGMDGAELRAYTPYLQKLLGAFAEEETRAKRDNLPPRATLVLTCREAEDIQPYLPRRNLSGLGHSIEEQCGIVRVDEFSWDELLEATSSLDGSIGRALKIAIATQKATEGDPNHYQAFPNFIFSGGDESTALSPMKYDHLVSAEVDNQEVIPADLPRLDLLRHPVLWYAFQLLTGKEQEEFLRGAEKSLTPLARQYVGRFCTKASERIQHLRVAYVADALRSVARQSKAGKEQTYSRAQFLEFAISSGVIQSPEHIHLYEESLSAGMITPEERSQWRWTHGFIHTYLAESSSKDLP
jgi:hypothetical protein